MYVNIRESPIYLFDAFNGSLRCSYRAFNHVEEFVAGKWYYCVCPCIKLELSLPLLVFCFRCGFYSLLTSIKTMLFFQPTHWLSVPTGQRSFVVTTNASASLISTLLVTQIVKSWCDDTTHVHKAYNAIYRRFVLADEAMTERNYVLTSYLFNDNYLISNQISSPLVGFCNDWTRSLA